MTKKILMCVVFLLLLLTGCNSNKAFKNGYAIVYQDGKPYLLNNQNETFDLSRYDEVSDQFGDYIVVKKYQNQKLLCGYINRDGQEVIKPKYEQAYPFSEGYAVVVDKGTYKLINTSNKVVYTFPENVHSYDIVTDGHLRVEKDGLFSFLRINDFKLHDTYYDGLENFSDGYALYHYYDNNKVKHFNFLDKNFSNVFKNELNAYDLVESFHDGYAKVGRYVGAKYYYSYVNKQGNLLVDSNNNSLFEIARNFSSGKAMVYTGKSCKDEYYTNQNGEQSLINSFHYYQYLRTDGTYIDYVDELKAKSDIISVRQYFYDFVGDLTVIHEFNSGAGFISLFKTSGNTIVNLTLTTNKVNVPKKDLTYYPTPYELVQMRETSYYSDEATILMVVRIQTNYCGIVNSKGEYITPAIYDRVVL